MKFGIDFGHGLPRDTGAKKLKFEDELIVEVGNKVVIELRKIGHEIVLCRPNQASSLNESLQRRVNCANLAKVDLFVSIHFNAFNYKAHGSEVFSISPKGQSAAQFVLEEIIKLGFRNRGVKDGSHLFVVRKTSMPAILVECCFCDSEADMKRFNSETMASAIINGLQKYAITQSAK
jgi:N-acetylmuramoyl-L-alanine amidase